MRLIGDRPLTAAERQRRYREAHPDRVRKSLQDYKERNPDASAAASRKHYHANKHAAHSRTRARRAAAQVFTILPREMRRLLSQPCMECGSTENLSVDHIIPLSRGGRHSIGNLQTLCRSCNNSKFNRFITEWRAKRLVAA